jgi:hypothetical protein
MADYLYEIVVTLVANEKRQFIGQYWTDASPPTLGMLFNPMHLAPIGKIPPGACKVVEVEIIPSELVEQPYAGLRSDVTLVNLTISPVSE